MIRRLAQLTLLFLIIIIPTSSRADFFNQRNVLVGERASMMGGAYTALADDLSAAYYNPAGLAYIGQPVLSMTANVYSYNRLLREDRTGTEAELNSLEMMPTSFGLSFGNGSAALAFSIFQIDYFSFSSLSVTDVTVSKVEIFSQSYLIGPSLGVKLAGPVSLGASVFYHYHKSKMTLITENPITDDTIIQNQMMSGGITAMIGVLWNISGGLRLGVNYGSETRNLHGENVYSHSNVIAPGSFEKGVTDGDVRLPHRVMAGLAYEAAGSFAVALDGIYYFGMSFDQPNGLLHTPDPLYEYEEREHVDVSLGGEIFMTGTLSLRLGAFTNTSGATSANRPERINLYGGSAGLGFLSGGVSSGIGASVMYGRTGWQTNPENIYSARWTRLHVNLIVGGSKRF